jgi:hypothetical protein
MGQAMARIAPAQANDEVFSQRNQYTARLYGIRPQNSATRIMSAIKYTGARTVHVPQNSKTGKKRNFAIIGFKNSTDLEKAITQYIYLFGCKTWWSTKDNTKALQKQQNNRKESIQHAKHNKYQESDQDSDSETDRCKGEPSYKCKSSYTSHSNRKQKNTKEGKNKDHQSYNATNNIDNMLSQLASQLSLLNDRLVNMESHKGKNNQYKKKNRDRPNLS